MFDVICLMFGECFVYDVSCAKYGSSCRVYELCVLRMMYNVGCTINDVRLLCMMYVV